MNYNQQFSLAAVRNGCRGEACCGGESYGSNWIKGSGDTSESEVFG